MEELASITNLRILGALVATLLLALFILALRYRKLNRRGKSLGAALEAQRDGLRLRDHMLADSDIFRLIVADQNDIIVNAGNSEILGLNLPENITLQDIGDCLVKASTDRFQKLLEDGGAGVEKSFEKLVTRDGRKIRCRASRVEAHNVSFLILKFQEPKEIHNLEKQIAQFRKQADGRTAAIEQFGGLIDLLDFPVWRRDPEQNIIWCNSAYSRAVGGSIEEAVSRKLEIESSNTTGKARALAQQALAQSHPASEIRYAIMDGARRALRIHELPTPDGGTIGHGFDVTELQDALSEIDRLVATQADVLNHLSSAIIIYGADKRVRFFNEAYTRIWNLDEDWLQTGPSQTEIIIELQNSRQLQEHANFSEYRALMNRYFTDLIEPEEELEYRPDGRILRRIIAPNPRGGLIFIHEDVTDVLALERSYNTLIATQSETLNNLFEGVAVYGTDGRVKLFNPAYARIWKLSEEFLELGPHVSDVIEQSRKLHPMTEDWETSKANLVEELTSRTPGNARIDRPDGMILDRTLVPLPDGNKLVIHIDVTDSQKIERFLRERNLALEDADQVKSLFLSNISYALRTPLTSISGFTDILTSGLIGKLDPQQSEYASMIRQAVGDLRRLIDDILDLSIMDADHVDMSFDLLDMGELLETSMTEFASELPRDDIQFTFDGGEISGKIIADGNRLRQVFRILLENAVQYSNPDGIVEIGLSSEGDLLQLSIKDHGIGIPEDDIAKVQQRFQRGSNVGHIHGIGLGLSLASRYVELHDGRIEIRSDLGKGTEAICYFPVNGPSPDRDGDLANSISGLAQP